MHVMFSLPCRLIQPLFPSVSYSCSSTLLLSRLSPPRICLYSREPRLALLLEKHGHSYNIMQHCFSHLFQTSQRSQLHRTNLIAIQSSKSLNIILPCLFASLDTRTKQSTWWAEGRMETSQVYILRIYKTHCMKMNIQALRWLTILHTSAIRLSPC
jgi:hypothetical protein